MVFWTFFLFFETFIQCFANILPFHQLLPHLPSPVFLQKLKDFVFVFVWSFFKKNHQFQLVFPNDLWEPGVPWTVVNLSPSSQALTLPFLAAVKHHYLLVYQWDLSPHHHPEVYFFSSLSFCRFGACCHNYYKFICATPLLYKKVRTMLSLIISTTSEIRCPVLSQLVYWKQLDTPGRRGRTKDLMFHSSYPTLDSHQQ